jgi:hypothetical protein
MANSFSMGKVYYVIASGAKQSHVTTHQKIATAAIATLQRH